jgi:YesN/AraC family two-component response regulator
LENLLFTLMHNTPSKRKVSQMTMALLFMQLLANTEKLSPSTLDETIIWQVLRYVESNYANGSFSQLCAMLHYDPSFLSRQITRKTGRTFTELIQEKRLAQAAFLLKNTTMNVDAIAITVGYENISYFHRLFAKVSKLPNLLCAKNIATLLKLSAMRATYVLSTHQALARQIYKIASRSKLYLQPTKSRRQLHRQRGN